MNVMEIPKLNERHRIWSFPEKDGRYWEVIDLGWLDPVALDRSDVVVLVGDPDGVLASYLLTYGVAHVWILTSERSLAFDRNLDRRVGITVSLTEDVIGTLGMIVSRARPSAVVLDLDGEETNRDVYNAVLHASDADRLVVLHASVEAAARFASGLSRFQRVEGVVAVDHWQLLSSQSGYTAALSVFSR